MNKKIDYEIDLTYLINLEDSLTEDAAEKLLPRLRWYFSKHNNGYEIFVCRHYKSLIINISGTMKINFTLVNSSAPGYHPETDGESSYDCDSRKDFEKIIICAFEYYAKDIVSWESDGKKCYLSDDISDYLSSCEDNYEDERIGYPSDDEIWSLLDD